MLTIRCFNGMSLIVCSYFKCLLPARGGIVKSNYIQLYAFIGTFSSLPVFFMVAIRCMPNPPYPPLLKAKYCKDNKVT